MRYGLLVGPGLWHDGHRMKHQAGKEKRGEGGGPGLEELQAALASLGTRLDAAERLAQSLLRRSLRLEEELRARPPARQLVRSTAARVGRSSASGRRPGPPRSAAAAGAAASPRCPGCSLRIGEPLPRCPYCGFLFAVLPPEQRPGGGGESG